MAKELIAIRNVSTAWSDQEIADYLPVLQAQISEDFAPIWGVDADITFWVDKTAIIPPNGIPVIIADHSTQVGLLGVHDKTKDGRAIAFVYAGDDLKYGEDPRTTLGHETCEVLRNKLLSNFTFAQYQGRMVQTPIEVCDAVEAQFYMRAPSASFHGTAAQMQAQPCTNFVTPAFFDTFTKHPAGTKFDFMGRLVAPMEIASGGYLTIKDPKDGRGWVQEFGEHVPMHKFLAPRGSRRERLLLIYNHERELEVSTAT